MVIFSCAIINEARLISLNHLMSCNPNAATIRLALHANLVRVETAMTSDETLRRALLTVEVNEDFTEAVMRLQDNSRLCFCHRVGERWAKAVGPEEREPEGGEAEELLSAIKMFRLNRKHLDIQFEDGSCWDEALHDFKPSNG